MSEVRTFFRHCPQCGRRFHIRLVSKKLKDARTEVERLPPTYVPGRFATLTEGLPITIEIEDFQYAYKCTHCGHEWSESRTEENKIG